MENYTVGYTVVVGLRSLARIIYLAEFFFFAGVAEWLPNSYPKQLWTVNLFPNSRTSEIASAIV